MYIYRLSPTGEAVLFASGSRHWNIATSPAIVDELAGVLRACFDWDDDQVIPTLKLLTKVAEIVIPNLTIDAISADDDDNRILECAAAGKADLIVSGDHHLRDLKSFRNIEMIRPVDFHRTLPDMRRS